MSCKCLVAHLNVVGYSDSCLICLPIAGLSVVWSYKFLVEYLNAPLFYSYHDYYKFETQSLWVYSNKKGKGKPTRHKISFSVLTVESNVLKSKCAAFANFIHKKDALVAPINTISNSYDKYGYSPIFTVHDCFVTYLLVMGTSHLTNSQT